MSSENTETDTWENRYRVSMNELWEAVNDTTPDTEIDVLALAAGTAFAAEIRQGLTAGLLSPSIYQARYQPRTEIKTLPGATCATCGAETTANEDNTMWVHRVTGSPDCYAPGWDAQLD